MRRLEKEQSERIAAGTSAPRGQKKGCGYRPVAPFVRWPARGRQRDLDGHAWAGTARTSSGLYATAAARAEGEAEAHRRHNKSAAGGGGGGEGQAGMSTTLHRALAIAEKRVRQIDASTSAWLQGVHASQQEASTAATPTPEAVEDEVEPLRAELLRLQTARARRRLKHDAAARREIRSHAAAVAAALRLIGFARRQGGRRCLGWSGRRAKPTAAAGCWCASVVSRCRRKGNQASGSTGAQRRARTTHRGVVAARREARESWSGCGGATGTSHRFRGGRARVSWHAGGRCASWASARRARCALSGPTPAPPCGTARSAGLCDASAGMVLLVLRSGTSSTYLGHGRLTSPPTRSSPLPATASEGWPTGSA
jgi:hypothetical protein